MPDAREMRLVTRPVSPWSTRVLQALPGFGSLTGWFARVAAYRSGRLPLGLIALLPVALLIDLFDVGDELLLGPVGMGFSFVLESAFILGVTGKPSYAFGFAGIDLVPGLDTLPLATLALVARIATAWGAPDATGEPRQAPVIDV